MTIHIIYTPYYDVSGIKLSNLHSELSRQGIMDIKFWEGLRDYPVAKAINRSHKQIIQYAKDNSLPEVCVWEDDVMIPAKDGWEYFLKYDPGVFDLKLGGVYLRQPEYKSGDTVKSFTGLHCYICHSRFYDTFLSMREDANPDEALGGLGLYKVCQPYPVLQRPGYSGNCGGMVDYNQMLRADQIYLDAGSGLLSATSTLV